MGIFFMKGKKSLWTCCKKGEWAFLKLFSLWSSNIRERRTILFLTLCRSTPFNSHEREQEKMPSIHQHWNNMFHVFESKVTHLITFFIWRLFFKLSLCRLKGPAEIPSSWFLPDAKYFAIAWSITHVFPNYMMVLLLYIIAMSRGVIKGGPRRPSQFSEHQKQVRFQQTHNQSLRLLFLTMSWDLCS